MFGIDLVSPCVRVCVCVCLSVVIGIDLMGLCLGSLQLYQNELFLVSFRVVVYLEECVEIVFM